MSRSERASVPALDAILGVPYPVLDRGFIRVIDYMGDDAAITQAARISHGQGTKGVSEDTGLIRYLMRHRHSTPFEMCEIKYHVKLPIFVARQWVRHRMASINETSARYTVLDNEFYIPSTDVIAEQSTTNRQGRGEVVTAAQADAIQDILREEATRSYSTYEDLLNEDEDGRIVDPASPRLARELARMSLTLNAYTQWYWKTDLHNLFHFLGLRADPHAQHEIREYANVIITIADLWVPIATAAFREYRLGAFTLSASMLLALRRIIHTPMETSDELERERVARGIGKREWTEFLIAVGLARERVSTF